MSGKTLGFIVTEIQRRQFLDSF